MGILNKALDFGLLVLRVILPLMLLLGHGLGKVTQLFSGEPIQFADPLGLGVTNSFILVVIAEFLCMIPLILGIFSRLFLIPPIISMAVAAFIFHSSDPFIVKEKALIYLIVFVTLFFTGPGNFSLQAVLKKDLFKNPLLKFISK